MISNLSFHINQLSTFSCEAIVSKFHGKSMSVLTESTAGDRMVDLAKIISSFAVMLLAVIAVGGALYWLLTTESGKKGGGSSSKDDFSSSHDWTLPDYDSYDSPSLSKMPSFSSKKSSFSVPQSYWDIETPKTTSSDSKEGNLAKSAEKYLKDGDLINAHKTIKDITYDSKAKEGFLAKLANAYLTQGDFTNAHKVIKDITYDSKTKEAFLAKLAHAYYVKDDFINAYKIIKDITYNHATREIFLIKLAEEYFKIDDFENSYKMIKEVIHDTTSKETFIIKILVAYHQRGLKTNMINLIKEVARNDIWHYTYDAIWCSKKGDLTEILTTLNSFATELENDCYNRVQDALEKGNRNQILNIIRQVTAPYKEKMKKMFS